MTIGEPALGQPTPTNQYLVPHGKAGSKNSIERPYRSRSQSRNTATQGLKHKLTRVIKNKGIEENKIPPA